MDTPIRTLKRCCSTVFSHCFQRKITAVILILVPLVAFKSFSLSPVLSGEVITVLLGRAFSIFLMPMVCWDFWTRGFIKSGTFLAIISSSLFPSFLPFPFRDVYYAYSSAVLNCHCHGSVMLCASFPSLFSLCLVSVGSFWIVPTAAFKFTSPSSTVSTPPLIQPRTWWFSSLEVLFTFFKYLPH